MIFTLREVIRWLGLTQIEILLNLIGVTISSILATFKLEGLLDVTWWTAFVALYICDGLNAYFCVIVFIRQYLEGLYKAAALRSSWSFIQLLLIFLFKLLLCLRLEATMKIWTSEHTFHHPWETVTQAAWRKYPNPMNPAVQAIDIVDRKVSSEGVLQTHRLISSRWGLPNWASRLLGADKTCYASEHSEVNPRNRVMTLLTKNITFCNEVSVVEKLTYSPHPNKAGCTLLKQEAMVTIQNVPLSSYIEDYLTRTISNNAGKGRQAMEWVISCINDEVKEISTATAKKSREVVEDLTKDGFKLNLHFDK